MILFVLRRLVLAVIAALGVTLAVFLLMRLTPGDPAEMIAYARYGADGMSPDMVEKVRLRERLDQPVFSEYLRWLGHVLKGDLGRSLISYRPVAGAILGRFPATALLAVTSLTLGLLFSFILGGIAAARQNKPIDHLIGLLSYFAYAAPSFWLGLLLVFAFSVKLGWLPVFGMDGVKSLILPSLTMACGTIGYHVRLIRASLLEVMGRNYVRTAYAKGISNWRIFRKHVLRNALIPIVTASGMQLSFFLGGSTIIESLFSWPGIGKLLVDAISDRDYAMVQGCVLFTVLLVIAVNLLVDLSYAFLNPQIRYKGAHQE